MGTSVLVVDDDAAFLDLATRVLRDMGADVLATAPDAASAVAKAKSTRPAAVLVDVGLPDRDGVDLGIELARLPWRPRVVLTSTDHVGGSARRSGLPFVLKEQLASGALRQLLLGDRDDQQR